MTRPVRRPSRLRIHALALAAAVALTPATGWGREPDLARLPMVFVPNQGQTHSSVRFQVDTLGGTAFFTPSELVLVLPRTTGALTPGEARDLDVGRAARGRRGVRTSVLRLRFVDAAREPGIEGGERLPGTVNFFRGSDRSRWQVNVPTFSGVVYRDLYPGIDLRYQGAEGRIKGSYVVSPGADPSRIRWTYAGARSTRLDEGGNLLLALPSVNGGWSEPDAPATVVMEEKPLAWQDAADGHRQPVAVRYAVGKDGSVGFTLPGGYDATRPLVLDPTITYSTYLGGGGEDVAYDVKVGSTGTFVTGYTISSDFPTQDPEDQGCGTDDFCNSGFPDAFVAKMNPAVSGAASMIFCTYLGGSDSDYGLRIAVDATGASYVTGIARADFPTTPNAFQQTYGGGAPAADAFLTKLSADGSELLYSTYLGGDNGEGGFGLALDASNNAYLVGQTLSTNFPATVGALDTACGTDADPACDGGFGDAFVAKIDPAASGAASLLFATYLGGAADERGYGIARDAANDIYVSGRTASTNFPMAGTPFQSTNGGGYDAFVAKINAAGTALAYATYLGGGDYDDAYSIALGTGNRPQVVGLTYSSNLPTSAGAFQPSFGGVTDAWFGQFDTAAAGAASRLYSTYIGGNDDDQGFGLAVDAADVAHVAGFVRSTDFPAAGTPFQPVNAGYWDGFLVKINPAISGAGSLAYSTYLGGGNTDALFGVALDASGNDYVVGQTYSTAFPIVGGFQADNGGGSDVFLARIDNAATSADVRVTHSALPDPVSVGLDLSYTVTVANDGPASAPGARVTERLLGNATFVSAAPSQGDCVVTYLLSDLQIGCALGSLASGATATVTVVANPSADGVLTSNATASSNVSDPDGADNTVTVATTALDRIFTDGFESGNTSAWSAVVSDSDLTVTAAAALAGSTRGLQAVVNGPEGLYVEDRTPSDERRYRARFHFDPNGFDPGTAQGRLRTRIFLALEESPTRRLVAIVLRRLQGQYAIRGRVRLDDNTVVDTPFVDISDAPHAIEFQWDRAGGPGFDNGYFEMWIDGASAAWLFGLDTDLHSVDAGRLGALSVKPGASGTLYFDEFLSRRVNYIGP